MTGEVLRVLPFPIGNGAVEGERDVIARRDAIEAEPAYAYHLCWHRVAEPDEARGAFIAWLREVCVEAQRP